jgi:mRNA interferase RelE/StbE
MYQLVYKKSAIKGLRKLPTETRGRMVKTLKEIAADPRCYVGDWKPLKGTRYWRLRIGRYRAICNIGDEKLLMLVLKIGPRGDVYK